MQSTWHLGIEIACVIILAGALAATAIFAYTWVNVLIEVKNKKRKPWVACEGGGHPPFPEEFGMRVEVPGSDTKQLMCPYCYEESLKRGDNILHGKRK